MIIVTLTVTVEIVNYYHLGSGHYLLCNILNYMYYLI